MVGLTDRIKLRPLVAAERGDVLFLSSEESAIKCVEPWLDAVWSPCGGEPVIGRLKEKREKRCPRCSKRVKVQDKLCRFCYYEFPRPLSLQEKSPGKLTIKFNGLSEKSLESRNSAEKMFAAKPLSLKRIRAAWQSWSGETMKSMKRN
jgi:ribosomal protein L37E